jgi:hypothetical protein
MPIAVDECATGIAAPGAMPKGINSTASRTISFETADMSYIYSLDLAPLKPAQPVVNPREHGTGESPEQEGPNGSIAQSSERVHFGWREQADVGVCRAREWN